MAKFELVEWGCEGYMQSSNYTKMISGYVGCHNFWDLGLYDERDGGDFQIQISPTT